MNVSDILFQFTPLREGRRCLYGWGSVAIFISIHAPPRGATRYPSAGRIQHGISIHAPPRGATFGIVSAKNMRMNFNSRPSARGDEKPPVLDAVTSIFQFTPLREGRLAPCLKRCSKTHFNSRPSARGDKIAQKTDVIHLLFQFTPLREGRRRR